MSILQRGPHLLEPVARTSAVAALFFFPALGGFIFGYDIGATSFVVVQLESAKYGGAAFIDVMASSALWRGIVTSGAVAAPFLSTFLVFSMAEVRSK